MYISSRGSILNGTQNGLLKRALRSVVKRWAEDDSEENSEEDEEKWYGGENSAAGLRDLVELLEYLKWRNRLRYAANTSDADSEMLYSNSTHPSTISRPSQEEFELPVALVQLLIIVLVFLIVFFMCKCNQMMERCRDCRRNKRLDEKQIQQFDEDR